MTAHTHTELVPGCYGCDLYRDEQHDFVAGPLNGQGVLVCAICGHDVNAWQHANDGRPTDA